MALASCTRGFRPPSLIGIQALKTEQFGFISSDQRCGLQVRSTGGRCVLHSFCSSFCFWTCGWMLSGALPEIALGMPRRFGAQHFMCCSEKFLQIVRSCSDVLDLHVLFLSSSLFLRSSSTSMTTCHITMATGSSFVWVWNNPASVKSAASIKWTTIQQHLNVFSVNHFLVGCCKSNCRLVS